MHLALVFLLLLGASFAVFAFALRPSSAEQGMQARIEDIRNPRRSLHALGENEAAGKQQPDGLSTRLGSYLERYSFTGKLKRLQLEADSTVPVGALVLGALASAGIAAFAALLFLRTLPGCLIGAALGLVLPLVRLMLKRKKRLKQASAELPDTADLMARSLRAGHSMTQTIEVLGEQAPPLLRAEFARVFQQQKLGVPLRDVLVEMGDRLPSRDLQFLVTAVLVQRETGGDLATVLDRTAHVLRERIQLQAQVQIHTAQGRLTGWILSLMPVVLLGAMMLFSRDYARGLFDDPIGRRLLYLSGGFIFTGAMIIRRIVGVAV